MRRLTTDNPQGNFETVLNYVYSQKGQAYIRADENGQGILLTDWIKQRCIEYGCDFMREADSQEVDELICDCAFDNYDCPLFVLYTCSCQAVHLRDRLRQYEDTGFMPDQLEGKLISRYGTAKCLNCGAAMDLMDLVPKMDT